jgi:hypothetical protein
MFSSTPTKHAVPVLQEEPMEEVPEESSRDVESREDLIHQIRQLHISRGLLMAENDRLEREAKGLIREVQRVSLLAAARLEFEGARVETPRGPGLVTYCGHEIEVCLDDGNVYYARYASELPRLTLPDARLAAIERRELKSARLHRWTEVRREGNFETVIARDRPEQAAISKNP